MRLKNKKNKTKKRRLYKMASEKVTKLIEEVKELTVLELSELVKELEEEFGVSAAAPLAAAAPAAAGAAEEEEQTEFDVVLTGAGSGKIKVIKAVKEKVSKEEAENIKSQIEEVGGSVEIK